MRDAISSKSAASPRAPTNVIMANGGVN
jgi:hypothetical protein